MKPDALSDLLDNAQLWKGRAHATVAADTTGYPGLDHLLPGGGWPRAALSEILLPAPGVGEMQLVLPWLARLTQAGGRVAMVRPPHIPYAPALDAAGVVLQRVCVVTPESVGAGHWAVEQMLRSGGFSAVLGWPGVLDMRDLRRLQLAAETGHASGLLFRDAAVATQASPAALRLRLHGPADRFEVEIIKSRGGQPGARWRAAA
jgi:hypothetical protein